MTVMTNCITLDYMLFILLNAPVTTVHLLLGSENGYDHYAYRMGLESLPLLYEHLGPSLGVLINSTYLIYGLITSTDNSEWCLVECTGFLITCHKACPLVLYVNYSPQCSLILPWYILILL